MSTLLERLIFEKRRMQNRMRAYIEYVFIFTDWYKVVFPFNRLFTGRELLLHMRNDMTVYVRDSRSKDLSAVREVIGCNDYHLENISLREGTVVFDIGANIGTFSMMAKKSYPTATIFAIEPHPENFTLLQKNAPFAISRQMAVTGRTGSVRFQATGSPIGFRVQKDGVLTVPSMSLDELTAQCDSIDLVKMDVEGSEYDIFQHISPETFRKVAHFLVEAHATERYTIEEGKKYLEERLTKESFHVTWIKHAILFASKSPSI